MEIKSGLRSRNCRRWQIAVARRRWMRTVIRSRVFLPRRTQLAQKIRRARGHRRGGIATDHCQHADAYRQRKETRQWLAAIEFHESIRREFPRADCHKRELAVGRVDGDRLRHRNACKLWPISIYRSPSHGLQQTILSREIAIMTRGGTVASFWAVANFFCQA